MRDSQICRTRRSFITTRSWLLRVSGNTTGTECESETLVHDTATPLGANVSGGTRCNSLVNILISWRVALVDC
jgi:hypothetical protein